MQIITRSSTAASRLRRPSRSDADRRAFRRSIKVLQHPCRARRSAKLQEVRGAVAPDQVGRLLQRAARRAAAGVALSIALHPPHCELQSPARRRRWRRRVVSLEGLSHRRSWPLENHDAHAARVHPPVPRPRAAEGLPPHPTLRPAGSANRAANIARARELLAVPTTPRQPETPEAAAADETCMLPRPCPCCGGRMVIIETFARGCEPKHRPKPSLGETRIDTS